MTDAAIQLHIDPDAHPGAMVALMLDADQQTLIRDATGMPDAACDHITLCYIGPDASALAPQKNGILAGLTMLASCTAPLDGTLGGIARFAASESSDDQDVCVALYDSPRLADLYQTVMACCGATPGEHGFTPHITLAYLAPDAPMPVEQVERAPLNFGAISLIWAGERIDLPLQGELPAMEETGAATPAVIAKDGPTEEISPTAPPPLTAPSSHIRLNLISKVALEADGATARPIHILRTGTFTGQSGKPVAFSADDLAAIASNFTAGKRPNPPITERHDWGRAVGRMADVWVDGDNLYSLPKWNAQGRTLLAEQVYDGFSVELDADDAGYILIGGSLTNYPAVGGLQPVSLSLPAIRAAQPTQEEHPMSDPEAVVLDLPPGLDASMAASIQTYLARTQEMNRQAQEAAFQRAQAEFERRIQEQEQRATIAQFSRAKTMTSIGQPWALPCAPDDLTALLSETPAPTRAKWMQLLNRIVTSGLMSFDEVGSSAEGLELVDQWSQIVASKIAGGMTKVEAIQAAGRAHPDLYAAQTRSKRGGR